MARTLKKIEPDKAVQMLNLTHEKQSVIFAKIIASAVKDAVENEKMNRDLLIFESIQVHKGPAFKRWKPVARGMAHAIKKRTSHVKITLSEKKSEIPNPKHETNNKVKKEVNKK